MKRTIALLLAAVLLAGGLSACTAMTKPMESTAAPATEVTAQPPTEAPTTEAPTEPPLTPE